MRFIIIPELGKLAVWLRILGFDTVVEKDRAGLFRICVLCNERLENVEPSSVRGMVPAHVFGTRKVFTRCPKCGKFYWRGTRWTLVNKFLDAIG